MRVFMEGYMNINTGKLASSTNVFIKKLKENETDNKIVEKDSFKEKLLNDFADIKFSGNNFKSRLINNNHRLSNYENELSQVQFLEQKYEVMVKENGNNNVEQLREIIDNSSYNNQNILKAYFENHNDLQTNLGLLKDVIDNKYASLDKEFKKIEVASQNIISLNSQLQGMNEDSIKNLKIDDLSDSTNLSNKRVMHLVF